LTKLIFGGDEWYNLDRDRWIAAEPATLEVGMTEADFSNKHVGATGAIIVAAWISHRDKGVILKFTFSGDLHGLRRHDSKPVTMETSMAEAYFGGKGLGLSGAIMVAAFLPKCT
jgi:hypothetical protein